VAGPLFAPPSGWTGRVEPAQRLYNASVGGSVDAIVTGKRRALDGLRPSRAVTPMPGLHPAVAPILDGLRSPLAFDEVPGLRSAVGEPGVGRTSRMDRPRCHPPHRGHCLHDEIMILVPAGVTAGGDLPWNATVW
jgi:hypothetical protein